MRKILTSIVALLSFVWSVSAQEVSFATDYNIQQKGDCNKVYRDKNPGKDYPMGCMAAAMTIVMKYNNAPDRLGDKVYDYTTVTGKNGLSQLMYDAALSIGAQFGPDETSAALSEVATQLVNVFGYDKYSVAYRMKAQTAFTDQQWVSLIVRDLNNGMPVIYSAGTAGTLTDEGRSTSERHAFVVDGYRVNASAPYGYEFHINGGQGQSVEGNSQWVSDIFSVTIGLKTYSDTPEMVTGIRTATEAAQASPLKIVSYNGSRGLSMSVDNISAGQPFDVTVASLQNWDDNGDEFTGYIFPVLVRSDGSQLVVTEPNNTAEIAARYAKGGGFTYRRTLSELSFKGVVFAPNLETDKNLTDYTLRLATSDGLNGPYRLIETKAGDETVAVGALPAVTSSTVKLTFTSDDVSFYRQEATSGSVAYPEITNTIEVPNGKTFRFFVKRKTVAGGDGTVVLTVDNKYLMKDFFVSQNFPQYEGVFFITPVRDMEINGQLVLSSNLEAREVDLASAGTLGTLFSQNMWNPCRVGTLTLTGVMNAEDFFYIRDNMPMLQELDLSAVDIVAYGSHPANTVPDAAFYKEAYNKDGYSLALRTVRLPESCTMIGSNAFMYCSALEEVHIPKNVSTVNYNAFFGCKRLSDVWIYNPAPFYVNWCVFKNISGYSTLHVPAGSKELFVGEENKNKLPGMIYSINEWYNRWHDGSPQGKCVEIAAAAEGTVSLQVMRTNYVAFGDGGQKPGTVIWNAGDGDFWLYPSLLSPVSYNLWKLRTRISYSLDGRSMEEYVTEDASDKGSYTFNLKDKLSELSDKGVTSATVKVDIYVDMGEAMSAREYFYPYIYNGMEVTITGGKNTDFYNKPMALRAGNQQSLTKANAKVTLDNAHIGAIETSTTNIDLVLKGENFAHGRLAGDEYFTLFVSGGMTLSVQGDGSLTLSDGALGEYPYAYSTQGGVINLRHGVTLKNLENMRFDNIQLTYTRIFDRVVSGTGGTMSGIGWETLSLPFDVNKVVRADGTHVFWATSKKVGDFWLCKMTSDYSSLVFNPDVEHIKAGESYIISVPDEGSYNLIGQALTFEGPTLTNDSRLVSDENFDTPYTWLESLGMVNMIPYPYYKDMSGTVYYSISRDGDSFHRWDSGSTEDADHVAMRQFEAYFLPQSLASAAKVASFSLNGETESGTVGITDMQDSSCLSVRGGDGAIIIESGKACNVSISSLDGRTRSVSVGGGTTRISVPAGLYIAGGRKVLVK